MRDAWRATPEALAFLASLPAPQLASGSARIPFPVTSCTGYLDRRHPTIREMEDVAWVLRTDATRKRIGFVQARTLKPRERHVLPDEDWLP